MLIIFIIIFVLLYELITVMYYESLKIRLVKVAAFIDHLNTFGSTEDKQIFYKFFKEVNTESIRCNAKLDITVENASKPELWYKYPSNPNTFKECFKLFNLCFYRNVLKDPIDKIIYEISTLFNLFNYS